MPLINCPACERRISAEAEACPQCGHPNRPEARNDLEPRCYSCGGAATTRCQSCGALSCAVHLQSIYVTHGRGGAYELRCAGCYSSAMTWKFVSAIVIAVILVAILLIWMNMGK